VTRVVIHIGLAKTGTSSLQKALVESADVLAAGGAVYPLPAGWLGNGHHRLALASVNGDIDHLAALWGEIEPLIGAPTIMLSSESFAQAQPRAITTLKEIMDRRLGGRDYKILLTIRRWPDRLVSLWHELVRTGLGDGLPAFLARELAREPTGHRLDIAPTIARWAEAFGADALDVMPVERISRDLVVEIFRRALAIDAPELAGRYRVNRSEIARTELMRGVARRLGGMKHGEAGKLMRVVWKQSFRAPAASYGMPLLAERALDLRMEGDAPLFAALERRSLTLRPGLALDGRLYLDEGLQAPYVPDEAFEVPEIAFCVIRLRDRSLRRMQRQS
jgi:hypothetical protein